MEVVQFLARSKLNSKGPLIDPYGTLQCSWWFVDSLSPTTTYFFPVVKIALKPMEKLTAATVPIPQPPKNYLMVSSIKGGQKIQKKYFNLPVTVNSTKNIIMDAQECTSVEWFFLQEELTYHRVPIYSWNMWHCRTFHNPGKKLAHSAWYISLCTIKPHIIERLPTPLRQAFSYGIYFHWITMKICHIP